MEKEKSVYIVKKHSLPNLFSRNILCLITISKTELFFVIDVPKKCSLKNQFWRSTSRKNITSPKIDTCFLASLGKRTINLLKYLCKQKKKCDMFIYRFCFVFSDQIGRKVTSIFAKVEITNECCRNFLLQI